MQLPTEEQKTERRQLFLLAEQNAKTVLKPGDRIRVSKCPGTKRWVTFSSWDGHWIVSKSGRSDYSPGAVDMLNGKPVNFNTVVPVRDDARAPEIWNCWTRNYSARDMGFITHAFDEHSEQYSRWCRALCGVKVNDTGLVKLGEDGWRPGCIRCCRILTGRKLLKPTVPPVPVSAANRA